MKELWPKRAQADIIDGHKEYFQDIVRIASPHFRPNNQDILRARERTTAVSMESYHTEGLDFEMYDVGGQSSERRKWMECFNEVDCLIFVAALSEYDQNLAESRRTNRMVEALELFRSVVNNRVFKGTPLLLFLNKKDIFEEKIMYTNIADQTPFRDYGGQPQNFDEGVQYFIQKFKECTKEGINCRHQFIHVTCATDTDTNMEFVLDSTLSTIVGNVCSICPRPAFKCGFGPTDSLM
jgi:signal recognition particle receptor subunit beta